MAPGEGEGNLKGMRHMCEGGGREAHMRVRR
jgi:hypothetical protein